MQIGEKIEPILGNELHMFNHSKHDSIREVSEEKKEIFPVKSAAIFIERELVKNASRTDQT